MSQVNNFRIIVVYFYEKVQNFDARMIMRAFENSLVNAKKM